jgi:ATP synthase protein I
MLKTVSMQATAAAIAALVALMWFGMEVAISVGVGGAAAVVPNGLFALRLATHKDKSPESYPVVFFLGEFVKIGFTIAILAMAYRWIPSVSGGGLMAGFIFALKAPLVVFFLTFIVERKNGLQF